MKHKALAFFLALCMVIAMLPAVAHAEPAAAAASGPALCYQPMSDVQPLSGVRVQPMVAVGDNELIIQHTEGGTVYYTTETEYYSARFWAYPDEGYYVESVLIEYTENMYTPSVNYLGFNEFGLHMAGCDVRITVCFAEVVGKARAIKIDADEHGTYTVTKTSAHAGEFFHVEAIPDQYYYSFCRLFTKGGEQIDPIKQGSMPNCYSFIMPDCDVTLSVEFIRYGPYTLNVKPFNAGGTISVPVEKAYYGEIVPITITPDPGYRVHYIDLKGFGKDTASVARAGGNIWNLTMGNGDMRIYISFTENINPITVNCGPGGTASANVTEAKEGDTVTLTCTPDEGYKLVSVTGVEGLVDNGDGTFTFPMPGKAVELDVTFKKIYEPITVTVETGIGGTAVTDVAEAKAGDTVTLICTPDEGYRVAQVTGAKLTDNGDGTYSFVMPDEPVALSVLFLRQNNPFLDVNETHFFHDSVLWAVENGITNGISAELFGPFVDTNRAAVVTMLWRYAGSPEPESSVNPFADVSEDAWYYKAVLWAVEKGITNGISADAFGPGMVCNRAQVVTFLWRFLNQPEPKLQEHPFTDVEADSWYETPVLWALENGITTGATADTFAPTGKCLRAHFVTFLYRTAQLPPPPAVYDLHWVINGFQDTPSAYGTVTLSHTAAEAGELITATVIPADGWQLDWVKCEFGSAITKVSDTEYTFIMPDHEEIFHVNFVAIPAE